MSDRFAYSALPTAAVSLGVACDSTPQRRTAPRVNKVKTTRSEATCWLVISMCNNMQVIVTNWIFGTATIWYKNVTICPQKNDGRRLSLSHGKLTLVHCNFNSSHSKWLTSICKKELYMPCTLCQKPLCNIQKILMMIFHASWHLSNQLWKLETENVP